MPPLWDKEEMAEQVVLAVVTSEAGVLVVHRETGNPRWAFPGGKIEAGETAAAAAAREVQEETGLQVDIIGEIGRREHPDTGADLVYMGSRTMPGCPDPLAGPGVLAARWVDYVTALRLMPDMFYGAQMWLAETIGVI
jgi:8-oxo-dGTP diphosphatase